MPSKLRIQTRIVPDFPIELFQTYQKLFEKVLSTESLLTSAEDGAKDLDSESVDLAFLSSTEYINLTHLESSQFDLVLLAPVFQLGAEGGSASSRAEIVVSKDKSETFKTFDDLRGHRWAVTDSDCIVGCSVVLGELRTMGHNANFFGSLLHTNTQRDVVFSILNKDADAGSVESSVLEILRRENPWVVERIHVLDSWGPYPPNPLVVSKKLSPEVVRKLSNALADLTKDHPEFVESFRRFGITGFQSFEKELFLLTSQFLESVDQEQLYPPYY